MGAKAAGAGNGVIRGVATVVDVDDEDVEALDAGSERVVLAVDTADEALLAWGDPVAEAALVVADAPPHEAAINPQAPRAATHAARLEGVFLSTVRR